MRSTFHRRCIIVDWGTTSLRAALIDGSGHVEAEFETPRGIQFITDRAFEPALLAAVGGWLAEYGPLTILALGMITSRNGWVEVPYVPCPATPADLAHAVVSRSLSDGTPILFLPGLTDPIRRPYPDVMRGEETQIVGYGLGRETTLVLPGTHSKWARVGEGRIQRFQTFVTGEIFALLAQHSFIAKAAGGPSDTFDWQAYDAGVREAAEDRPEARAALSLLFAARTGMLAGKLAPSEIRDYVSGLLIGHEFAEAQSCGWFRDQDRIGIVGNDGLNARYGRAARVFGLTVEDGGEAAAITGALAIAAHIPEFQRDPASAK